MYCGERHDLFEDGSRIDLKKIGHGDLDTVIIRT